MNLFKRSKSIVAKNIGRQQDSSSSPSPSSSSRQPLVPQTNIDHHPPKSPLSPLDNHVPSSNSNPFDNSQSKHLLGKKISQLDVEGPTGSKTSQNSASHSTQVPQPPGLTPPPRSSPRSAKSNYSDLYTQNDLHTFSFGAAPSASSSSLSPSIDPLSRPRDEVDSDEVSLMPDTTPRPSVVGGQHSRSHQSQSTRMDDWPPSLSPSRIRTTESSGEGAREPDTDSTSVHTFGYSSASASASSLSRPSRATSRVSGHSSTTPLTSGNDMTSDDDDDMIGRHPLPPEPRQQTASHDRASSDQDMYLSEEDFTSDDEHGIEVDSVVNETGDRGPYYDYASSRDNDSASQSGRRGSLAMAIPGASSSYDQRAKDYSGGRRPSRSLEDLRNWSFEQGQGQPPESRPKDYSIPVAPTSVPESEGDWRDLRKRSMQRDKDLPPVVLSPAAGPSSTSDGNNASPRGNAATEGFDTSWLQPYGVNGVVGIDASEMADIVGVNGFRGSIYSYRKGSTASATRRQSTVSSSIDIMHRNIAGPWSNEKDRDQRKLWTFAREKDRSDADIGQRHSTVQERERPSISSLFVPRPSTSTEDYSLAIAPFLEKPESKEKEKTSLIHRSKTAKEPWKGMALNSEEIWFNASSGKYRVMRRNASSLEAGKPPQQRVNITFIRSPYVSNVTNREPADGPAVTIHKHSKAAAFSISRHYRTKPAHNSATSPRDTTVSLRHSAAMGASSKDSSDGSRKKGNMILLGTRKVQKAYTSTNTTRKLDAHGFFDDPTHTTSRDAERSVREDTQERHRKKNKEKEREKEKEKSERGKDKRKTIDAPAAKRSKGDFKTKDSKSKSVGSPSNALPDSSGSSAGSVFNAISSGDSRTLVNATPVATPDLTESTSSAGSVGSIEQSIMSQETTSSDRTVSRANLYRSRHRKHDIYEISDDDLDDDAPRYPSRTPHHEAYAALPPEVFESAHQENAHTGLFGWGRSKGGDRHGHHNNSYLQAAYNPPWPVTQPRHKTENRKGIVEDLNSSFQDVGLLPAIGEVKGSSSHHSQSKRKREQPKKHTKRLSDKIQVDIFNDVPEDALYMLLPLWPGETDPQSAKRHPFSPPLVPTEERQYLMIYYKSDKPPPPVIPEEGGSKSKSGEKKRSQDAPPSGEPAGDKAILLSNFHITARVLAYRDLQGTGVRIPDAGLAVSGPLEDAFEGMPHRMERKPDQQPNDYVLGVCHNRDVGLEFYPEGFNTLGLTRTVPNPRPFEPSEDDDNSSFDTITILTPMGRAVMEMAWLGAMALTSFNPKE